MQKKLDSVHLFQYVSQIIIQKLLHCLSFQEVVLSHLQNSSKLDPSPNSDKTQDYYHSHLGFVHYSFGSIWM